MQRNRSNMKCRISLLLLLILAVEVSADDNRFFISAPGVFHVGVKEKVFVQMGKSHLNNVVTLYLEHETTSVLLSERKTVTCTAEEKGETVEEILSRHPLLPNQFFYLSLIAESHSLGQRKKTNVLVSQHRGYIFIQTNQPLYKPTQTGRKIFTLDHKFRPHVDVFHISIYNAAGNRVMTSLRTAKNGIMRGTFIIPDVTKTGTWTIKAYYEGDEANAASRQFEVQKFLLPSFEVNIAMEQKYILLNTEQFDFTILAKYSHGEKVTGAYHCMLGVTFNKRTIHGQKTKPVYVKGLDLTGSVTDGAAELSLRTEDLNMHLQNQLNQSLSDLQDSGAKIYLGVFVTNIQSGEIQERDVSLPIIAHRYTIDLSRTRSYFIPGFPLDVVVSVRHPDGSPAAGVPVRIELLRQSWQGTTDQQGTVFNVFNLETATEITVEVSVDGQQKRKVITRASSPRDSYLYLSVSQRTYSVGETLTVTCNTRNAPNSGFIHYMILSRGAIIDTGHLPIGTVVTTNLLVKADMMPSFRLIGYFYNQQNDIITDSVWVDVKGACELKVEVTPQGPNDPGRQSVLDINLFGQQATVALLGVDKAFYGLNVDNKLTPKQVYSSMQSYDLGCSYGGGSNPASVLIDAGLTFFSQSTAKWRQNLRCNSQQRLKRSVNLQEELTTLKSNFSSEKLQDCCVRGFTLLPMSRTCQERTRRVSQVDPDPECAEVFLKCCLEGERLRQIKINEDARKGFGRTSSVVEIEEFFLDTTEQYIRRVFPPSIAFTEFEVNGQKRHSLTLPDSITTWEIQVVTLSATTGLCVVQPSEIKAFKRAFVSLKLPYSVKKYEQISISPVIYNYGDDPLRVAVHMEQTQGLCSPASATAPAYIEITVKNQSSQFVPLSAVPMTSGPVPIKIRLYDIENERGIDAIEKTLNVWTEGYEQRKEEIYPFKLNETNPKTIIIDGSLPNDIVPESRSNIFVSLEANGFANSYARKLLSPEKVATLIVLPTGCLEQTTIRLSPTVLAVRYLDMTNQWFHLPPNSRDNALYNVEQGVLRMLTRYKKSDGSYGSFYTVPSSTWVTALVVKVLSMVAERQRMTFAPQGRRTTFITEDQIRDTVRYLVSIQNPDGTFGDKNPVLHRGVLTGTDHDAAMTAFVALALNQSLPFLLTEERDTTEATLLFSTSYLQTMFEELVHPYAVAITAYCLSVCKRQPNAVDRSFIWTKLQALATETEDGCSLWPTNTEQRVDAITIETTAYALLTAVALQKNEWADKTACWLTTQENYLGGYRSSQDTIMTLEALAEYALMLATSPDINVAADFTVQGKNNIIKLELENKWERVETDLKRFVGNQITAQLTGEGESKLKIVKVYHMLEPKDHCDQMSVKVTAEGEVKYTAKVIETYDYYYDDDNTEERDTRVPRSAIEWFDARTRNKRGVDNNLNSGETLNYTVCVSLTTNLTGMAIADITLLSGFEAVIEDLERLKQPPERYISHYEVTYGRVLLYFDELFDREECISFDAIQKVPIGLLQPAPAVFYDYYEPARKCTVFYSAPQRSRMVSTLCSEDVCQCAERPCHKLQNTFKHTTGRSITKEHRRQHACFFHNDDYAYIVKVLEVSVKSNFELYKTSIVEVLRSSEDRLVSESSVRVFAKRLHCKEQLDVGVYYLIMGQDGTTTDSDGAMQYLLEADTWVEKKPLEKDCRKSAHRAACVGFDEFTQEYKMDGCRD
uniref:Complement 4B (Chido blood group) n=1 Tax=Sphaeramia orbicularis TaxID=375764 RepID=A0A672ZPR3_9TELE